MESARAIIEVVAGAIPQSPMEEYTKRWAITSAEWYGAESDDARVAILAARNKAAQEYAATLMMRPDWVNWVRTDWLWL
jgi:hypothetical protein